LVSGERSKAEGADMTILSTAPNDTTHIGEAGVSDEVLRTVFRNHPAGVVVITADAGRGPVGLTATSIASVATQPPLFMFSLSTESSSTSTILEADTFVLHLVGAQNVDLAKLCATSGIDRFADSSSWTRLPTGEPYFHRASIWVRARIVHRFDAGSATVVVAHALESNLDSLHESDDFERPEPLVYFGRNWHLLGEHSVIVSP